MKYVAVVLLSLKYGGLVFSRPTNWQSQDRPLCRRTRQAAPPVAHDGHICDTRQLRQRQQKDLTLHTSTTMVQTRMQFTRSPTRRLWRLAYTALMCVFSPLAGNGTCTGFTYTLGSASDHKHQPIHHPRTTYIPVNA
jgi:hypothetical protein